MEFKCSACDYTSSSKFSLERHINKQKKCGENQKIIEMHVNINCEYCNKSYKTKEVLGKHLKICKVKKSSIEKELEKVKKELQELKNNTNVNNTINNTNVNNTINIVTNNYIQLRPYNNPRLPADMDDIYEDAWGKQKSVQTYIERVHFNTEFPENHNICITNLRARLAAKVFNGENWETKDQDQIIDEIIKSTNILLERWVKRNKKRREKYEEAFIEFMEGESKKKYNEETKNELKLLLYDNYKNGIVNIKSSFKEQFNEDALEDEDSE